MEFVSSYLKFDLLYSKEEMVHDCLTHVKSTILFLLSHRGNRYNRKQEVLRKFLGEAYQKLIAAKEQQVIRGITEVELQMSEAILGLAADSAYAGSADRWSFDEDGKPVITYLSQNEMDDLPYFLRPKKNIRYLKSRFGEDCTLETFQEAWKKVYRGNS